MLDPEEVSAKRDMEGLQEKADLVGQARDFLARLTALPGGFGGVLDREAIVTIGSLADEIERLRQRTVWPKSQILDLDAIGDMVAKIQTTPVQISPEHQELINALTWPNPSGCCATETSMIATGALIELFDRKNEEIEFLRLALREAVDVGLIRQAEAPFPDWMTESERQNQVEVPEGDISGYRREAGPNLAKWLRQEAQQEGEKS